MKIIAKYWPVLFIVVAFFFYQRWQAAKRQSEIDRENAIADSAQLIVVRAHGDSMAVAFARYQHQQAIAYKDLSRTLQATHDSLHLTTKALTSLQIAFDSVVGSHTFGTRAGVDTIAGPPVEGWIAVLVEDTSHAVTLNYSLRPSPFTMIGSLSCSPNGPVAAWDVPRWVRADVQLGTVDPEVCHPSPQWKGLSLFNLHIPWYVVAVGGIVVGWEVKSAVTH